MWRWIVCLVLALAAAGVAAGGGDVALHEHSARGEDEQGDINDGRNTSALVCPELPSTELSGHAPAKEHYLEHCVWYGIPHDDDDDDSDASGIGGGSVGEHVDLASLPLNQRATCCSAADDEHIGHALESAHELLEHKSCADVFSLLLCARCSPRAQDFTDEHGKVRVCRSFCKRQFNACKEEHLIRSLLGEEGLEVDLDAVCDEYPEDNCFNSASAVNCGLVAAAAAVLVAVVAGM